jgi:hypothetical protein
MSVIGSIIIFLSFCFGFYTFMTTTNASQAGLGDVAFLIAFYGLTLLWGMLGATLLICGTIKTSYENHAGKA